MKNRIGILLLILLCLGLGVALFVAHKRGSERQAQDTLTIGNYSNRWVTTSGDLEKQMQVSADFEKDLRQQQEAYTALTNEFTRTTVTLAQVSTNLASTQASLKAAEQEMKKREERIAELESANQNLDKQALELGNAITNLSLQITETKRKLATSEGDRAFLEKELKRLTLEKAELERQFSDLAVLRAQVAKLKEELSIARRIDWIRRGLFASTDEKGAQRLVSGLRPTPATPPKTNYDLNVEVTTEGGARVTNPTNPPAAQPAPAK